MWKKIFSIAVLINVICASAMAAKCPIYLDAEKNYILYADLGEQGAGLYVDRHTCSIAEENAVGYIILIDTVEVPDAAEGKTRITNRYTHKYSYDMRYMIAYRYEPYEDKWIKLDPTITNVEDDNFTYDVRIAEMAWYLALGDKFFQLDDDFYKILVRR